jgi:hypothetical protein
MMRTILSINRPIRGDIFAMINILLILAALRANQKPFRDKKAPDEFVFYPSKIGGST